MVCNGGLLSPWFTPARAESRVDVKAADLSTTESKGGLGFRKILACRLDNLKLSASSVENELGQW